MRNIGLLAFGTTVGILVPAAALHLTAGPKERAMLFAPGAESLDVNGTHVEVTLDRTIVDPDETVKLKLVGDKAVALGIVVMGSTGSEESRVPSPPVAVAHREVTLKPDWSGKASAEIAVKLKGARTRSYYNPFGTYTFYVMSTKAADRLADVRSNVGTRKPTDGIPDEAPGEEKMWQVLSLVREAAAKPDLDAAAVDPADAAEGDKAKDRDQKLFVQGSVARLEAYTRPVSKAVAITAPDVAPAGKPFDVGITVTNSSKRAQHLKVVLSFPPMDNQEVALKEEAIKVDGDKDGVVIDLGKGETKRVDLRVTGLVAGVLGMQAHLECERRESEDDDKLQKKYDAEYDACDVGNARVGTFEAVKIESPTAEHPTNTFAFQWP